MLKPGLVFVTVVMLLQGAAQADCTTPNPKTTWGMWEGWGTSLCWWANAFGARDDLADLVFTTNHTRLNGQTLPGLGMNIVRYNVGACSSNSIDGRVMEASAKMPGFKQMAGFWLDGSSDDPASASWSWTADANQRAMLLKARARGANLFELFSNSPMWWMCGNGNPSGANSGTNDNLKSSACQAHAVYLATVAGYARDHWGITFDSVEPFNEPIANWWSAVGTQEGCHFDVATQTNVIGCLRVELNRRGLTTMKIAASDENTYDQAVSTWNGFGPATKALVGRVNVHGYQYGEGRRDLLHAAVAGKRLWNSEYGEDDISGVSLARNLNLDFHLLHPTAWCYWQPFDITGWGLIQSRPGRNQIGAVNLKYFVLAHYTRHIRPGMTIMDSGDDNTVAAYDAVARKLVIVTMNYSPAQTVTYNLTNFANATGPVRRWITTTSPGSKYESFAGPALSSKVFTARFATNTIQTFEIQNVD